MLGDLRVGNLCRSIPSITAVNQNGSLVAFDFVCDAYSASQDLLQEFETEWSLNSLLTLTFTNTNSSALKWL